MLDDRSVVGPLEGEVEDSTVGEPDRCSVGVLDDRTVGPLEGEVED